MLLLTFILSSNSSFPWYWPLIGALAGMYLFYRGFQLLQRKRLILNTPASKIRSASMGLVEVSGLAAGPYTIIAPVTGLPCYYYRTIAWQWKQSGKNGKWEKVADESLHVPFYLDDNTGRVLVDPQGAEMEIHRDFHDEFSHSIFSSGLDIPANVFSFLGRNGISDDQKLKVEEYCIKPKNALFVLGTLAENHGLEVTATPVRSLTTDQHTVSFRMPISLGGLSLSTSASTEMTFAAFKGGASSSEIMRPSGDAKAASSLDTTQQEKISAAMIKAGITNPAAWEAAGIALPGVNVVPVASNGNSAGAAVATEQFDLHPPVVLKKGMHNPAFFISWRSQRDVVKALGWKSAAMIWGGPALALLCVYLLAAQFGWL